jgi:hypothetical protein
MLVFIVMMSVFAIGGSVSATAQDAPGADFSGCPDDSNTDADARQACGIKNEKGSDGKSVGDTGSNYNQMFNGGYSNIMEDDLANANLTDAWSMMMYRIINPGYYLNSSVSTDGGQLNTQGSDVHSWKPNRYCSSLDRTSDYTNDNCDVPGITTQALQTLMYTILPSSISGGEKVSAKSPFNIGIPTSLIPGGSVPVNRGSNKYTALEIFGYNLKWSTYNGEWDKIDVLTADRLTSEMSISDDISAAYQSVTNGISKAAGNASADVASAWNSKNLLSVAGSILSWPFKTAFNTATNSVYNFSELMLNGYERNIFDSNAWNRNSFYNDTAYNIRVLSDTEKTNVYLALVQTLIEDSYSAIADQYHIDVSNIEAQAAFPSSAPASKKDDDNETTESSLWQQWIKANKAKLEWGKDNIGVDYTTYSPSSVTKATDEYAILKSDWNSKATAWKTQAIQDKLKSNLESFQQAWSGESNSGIASSAKAEAKSLIKNNSLFWVCTNDDGTVQGTNDNGIIKMAIQGGLRDPGASAFDNNGNYQCKDSSGKVGALRQPISGALFGQQGTSEQKTKHADTRRQTSLTLSSLFGNPLNGMAQFGLGISQKIAMLINYLIDMSFQPILSSLGIKSIVINVIDTLKTTMYMQLLVIFVVIGVMVAFVKAVRGHAIEGFKSIFLIIMTVLLGVILLYSPNAAFKLIDDYPSYIERAAASMILQTSSSPNSDICTSTASPTQSIDANKYTDLNGSKTKFDPDNTVRMIECNIWDAYVFEPWVMGQFGTGYSQLYATGHASSTGKSVTVNDATSKLIGDAGVNMGGGTTIHNWALYQLSKQVSGTSTTDDSTQSVGTIDKNLYRLVDMQAGVDNAAGKDTSHWQWWKGSNQRVLIGGMAIAASVGGLFSIGMFAIAKIEATVMMSVLMAIAPIMLLIGIIPGSGRNKMKSWLYKILSLAFKRVILVVLLSVQLVILILVAGSNQSDVMSNMMFMTAMSIIFSMYGKSIIKAFTEPIAHIGGDSFMDINVKAREQIRNSRFMTNVRSSRDAFANLGGAIVGSAVVGGFVGQNSSTAIFSRYENSVREESNKKYRKKMSALDNSRTQLMDAYRAGTLTGAEYDTRQGMLNDQESEINAEYRKSSLDIDSYKNDFKKRREILANPKYREEIEGMDQLKRTARRSMALNIRRQHRNGNINVFRDSVRAVGELKDEQIKEAYNTIFDENPEVGAALLGVNSTSQIKKLSGLIKGVDLQDIADQLNLKAGMSAQDTLDEMDRLGITYRRTNQGEYIPIIPTEIKNEFRRKVVDKAEVDDIKRSSIPGSSKQSKRDNVTKMFKQQDAIEAARAAAIDAAEGYLPKNEDENNRTRADFNDSVIKFGSIYDHVRNGDASSSGEIEHQQSYDKVINNELEKKIHDINYDDSMPDDQKKIAIAKAKSDAGAERNKHVASTDYVIGQASEAARKEIMKIVDAHPNLEFYKDAKGNLAYKDNDTANPQSSNENNDSVLEKMKKKYSDYVATKTFTTVQSSNKAESDDIKKKKKGATGILDIADDEINSNVRNILNGETEYAHKKYGERFNNPFAKHDKEQSITDEKVKGDTLQGSELTEGRTNKQLKEDISAEQRRQDDNRKKPYRHTRREKLLDNESISRDYRNDAEEYHKKTGKRRSGNSRTTPSNNTDHNKEA